MLLHGMAYNRQLLSVSVDGRCASPHSAYYVTTVVLTPFSLVLAHVLFSLQHGEIIESSYLLGDKGPKSTWTRALEMVVLVATVGGCAYLMLFLFHHGNHHPAERDSASHPHRPVGASSSSSKDDASCSMHPACEGERGRAIGFRGNHSSSTGSPTNWLLGVEALASVSFDIP